MPDTPASTDVVVIGGGIMGTSIAYHLARMGERRVTLLERTSIASGASGRTGALLRQHYTNRPEATLAHHSLAVFRNWSESVGGTCGFDETGLVVTIPIGSDAEQNVARFHRNIEMQRSLGIDTVAVTPEELKEIDPFAQADDVAVAAYERSTGCVDAIAATQGMARAAVREGARILEETSVDAIGLEGNRIAEVRTSGGTIRCGTAIIANGPWSPRLVAPLGIDLPVDSARVQVATFLRPIAETGSHPAYVDIAAGMFCRPAGAGRTMVGVSGGDQHDAANADRYDQTIDAGYPDLARAALARRHPSMRASAFLHGHAGLYDMTPDAHPIIGHLPIDGLFIAAGFSGAGFKKGPAVGQAMAELIVHGQPTFVDLRPFRLERFDEPDWERPWSDSEYILSADFGHKF
jgi:sarcosine oxidase subunit beta